MKQTRFLDGFAKPYGITIAKQPVCRGHCAPIDFVADWVFRRPTLSLVHGPRGGGKSYLRAFATHADSILHDRHSTRVLGGSLAQSQQVYHAIKDFRSHPAGLAVIPQFTKTQATYSTGSEISILAASSTSVRGPHVATLCLDEVDEIDPEIRESAFGMCMEIAGVPGSIAMTSTWHRIGGPMEELLGKGRDGAYPVYSFCTFEVLERCPDERSGPDLENCPECPLVRWCHDEMGPKAKRAAGHYSIDSLIQKMTGLSIRVFESDYLCLGPKADGVWFRGFDRARHVSEAGEYDPSLPVHLSIDSGVHAGAVFFQVRRLGRDLAKVNVFADFYAEGMPVHAAASKLLEIGRTRCNGVLSRVSTDPAGGHRNAMGGPTVTGVYEAAGLRGRNGVLEKWPVVPGFVADALTLVDSFVEPASEAIDFLIHPRARHTINAMESYQRAKRQGQWQDYPADPQHPAEDLVDALKGGLKVEFPKGRNFQPGRTTSGGPGYSDLMETRYQ